MILVHLIVKNSMMVNLKHISYDEIFYRGSQCPM